MPLVERDAHLDAGEGSLGVKVDVGHLAATPPGLTVTVDCECVEIKGQKVTFKLHAHDGVDLIGEGRHERYIVPWEKFNARVAEKAHGQAVKPVTVPVQFRSVESSVPT